MPSNCSFFPAAAAFLSALLLAQTAGAQTTLLDVINPELDGLPTQDADPGPEFGAAVAADGDWLVVGMPRAITSAEPVGPVRGGRVTLYRRRGDAWDLVRHLIGNVTPDFEDARCGRGVGMVDGGISPAFVYGCPSLFVSGAGAGAGMVVLATLDGNAGYAGMSDRGDLAGEELGCSVSTTRTSDGTAYAAVGAPGGESVRVYRRAAGGASWSLDTTLTPVATPASIAAAAR